MADTTDTTRSTSMGRPNKSALKKPIWQEPPLPRKGKSLKPKAESPWIILRRQLMKHPNKWGVISIHKSVSAASATKAALIKRNVFPRGEYDMVVRTVDGKGRLYARYVLKSQDTQ